MKNQFRKIVTEPSWEKEMMRLPKEILISLLKKELLKGDFQSIAD